MMMFSLSKSLVVGGVLGAVQLGKHLYNTRVAPQRIAQTLQRTVTEGQEAARQVVTVREQQVLRDLSQRFTSSASRQHIPQTFHVGHEWQHQGKQYRTYLGAPGGSPIALAEISQRQGQPNPKVKVLAHITPSVNPSGRIEPQWHTRASGSILRRLWHGHENPAFVQATPRTQNSLELARRGALVIPQSSQHPVPPPVNPRYTQLIPQNDPHRAGLEQGRRYVGSSYIDFAEPLKEGFRDGGRHNDLALHGHGRREIVVFSPRQDTRLSGLYQSWEQRIAQLPPSSSERTRLQHLVNTMHQDVANGATGSLLVQNSDQLPAGQELQLGEIIDKNAVVCRHYSPIFKGFIDTQGALSNGALAGWQAATVRGHYQDANTQGTHVWNLLRTPSRTTYLVDVTNNTFIQVSGVIGWMNRHLGRLRAYQPYGEGAV